MKKITTYLVFLFIVFLTSCHSKIKERKDEIYSRHLQKHITLTVITTPVPKNKSDFNLLLLNDGQEIEKLRVKKIVDSLFRKKLIQPVIVVGINAYDRMQEYGVAGKTDDRGNGASAEKYAEFVTGELLPFVKKKAGVRKFNSVTIAGSGVGGLSAFDIAWDNADKFDKVGVFSGSFGLTTSVISKADSAANETRIIMNKIRSSRKKPHLQYWFYAGGNTEVSNDESKNEIENTQDLIDLIKKKNVSNEDEINYVEQKDGSNDYDTWSQVFPQFLLWSVGK